MTDKSEKEYLLYLKIKEISLEVSKIIVLTDNELLLKRERNKNKEANKDRYF